MNIGKILLQSSLWVLICTFGAFAQPAPGSDYPTQTVKIVVPFSAGSNTDILARGIADKLASLWKQTVIVENKPGIAGTVSAANSAPDGYTLMLTSNGHSIIKLLNKDVGIDPVNAFTGVAEVASIPMVLIVPPNSSAMNLNELLATAKDKPGSLNFATAGLASSAFIAAELLKQTAKIDIVHIPYKGTPEQLTSIMRGDAQMAMAFVGTALGLIQSGQVRALAVASPQGYPSLPNIPTFAEAGFLNINTIRGSGSWFPQRHLRRSFANSTKRSQQFSRILTFESNGTPSARCPCSPPRSNSTRP